MHNQEQTETWLQIEIPDSCVAGVGVSELVVHLGGSGDKIRLPPALVILAPQY